MRGVWLLSILLPLVPGIKADGSLYPPGLMPLINHANSLLSAGKFGPAATAYSQAIEQSPTDYVLYYKRATAYYSLNKHPSALQDFEKVLELTSSSFDKAHLMKARIHAKGGNWTEAKESLELYKSNPKSESSSFKELDSQITEGEAAHKKATQAARAKLWTACEEAASTALAVAAHSLEIRQQRAECSLAAGDLEMAVGDLTRLIHLTAPSTSQFMRIFRLTYFLLPTTSTDSAMNNLKQCLHYDPDSKECFAARRLVKNFGKTFDKLQDLLNSEDWKGAISLLEKGGFASKYDQALDAETTQEILGLPPWLSLTPPRKSSPRREAILRGLCKSYVRIGQPKKGDESCRALGQMVGGHEDADALLGQGEVLLANEEYEEAVRVMEKAWDACGRKDRYFQQRVTRAQKLLKQSKQKDYYKVLGVSRDADQKTIKKAFRRAAVKAHPDKGGSEAKMAAVNEAYEVLTDPELRQRFDNGDDPNDPMAQQGGHPSQGGGFPGGQHPFAHFFQGGGHHGGGDGFKFTYGFN